MVKKQVTIRQKKPKMSGWIYYNERIKMWQMWVGCAEASFSQDFKTKKDALKFAQTLGFEEIK